jgi:sulfite oxidase
MSTYRELNSPFITPEESFNNLQPGEMESKHILIGEGLFLSQDLPRAPKIDVENYQLSVTGLVKKELLLSFEDIQEEFPKVSISTRLEAADEGVESDLNSINQRRMISTEAQPRTSRFSGIRLRHVLLAAGVNPDTRYVAFKGFDTEPAAGFSGLIPIRKAMSPEVILAYEINDEPMPISKGFPLRLLVPGNDQTMSLKWIQEIRLLSEAGAPQSEESIRTDLPAGDKFKTTRLRQNMLPEAPSVIAVICNPKDGETVLDDLIIVEGYAMAVEGCPISRVELSSDGGKSWTDATILKNDNPWAWCFWESYLKLRPGPHQILVRAHDEEGNTNGIQKTHPHSIGLKILVDD